MPDTLGNKTPNTKQIKMSESEFVSILTQLGVPHAKAHVYAAPLIRAFNKADITTPLRIGHALAQLLHESQLLTRNSENLNYSASRLRQVFPRYFPNADVANLYAHKPEKIANRVYANRMENGGEASGDGWKYRGRGPLQITGKRNYKLLNAWLNDPTINTVIYPDLVSQAEIGCLGFAWYWDVATGNSLNKIADIGDGRIQVGQITQKINGGQHGLEDRVRLFSKAMLYLRKLPTYKGDRLPL